MHTPRTAHTDTATPGTAVCAPSAACAVHRLSGLVQMHTRQPLLACRPDSRRVAHPPTQKHDTPCPHRRYVLVVAAGLKIGAVAIVWVQDCFASRRLRMQSLTLVSGLGGQEPAPSVLRPGRFFGLGKRRKSLGDAGGAVSAPGGLGIVETASTDGKSVGATAVGAPSAAGKAPDDSSPSSRRLGFGNAAQRTRVNSPDAVAADGTVAAHVMRARGGGGDGRGRGAGSMLG